MKTGYKVCDAMTKRPIVVSPDTSIRECAKVMNQYRVGSLLIKENDKLVGVITDQDIVRKIVAKEIDLEITNVNEYMAKKLITISPEKDIFEALTIMAEENLKQLPVMDGKQMVGLLTQKDVLKIEPELFDLLVDKLEIKDEEHKPFRNEGVCQECGNFSKKLIARNSVLICKECNK